jgi:hypothetical protein
MTNNSSNPEVRLVDPTLEPIEAGLDRLAHAERSAAPAGLNGRLLAAVSREMTAPVVVRQLVIREAPVWSRSAIRLAASIAILAAIGSAWLALRPASGAGTGGNEPVAKGTAPAEPTVAAEIPSASLDALAGMVLASSSDDSIGAEIDLLMADATRVGDAWVSPAAEWSADSDNAASSGGAM